MSEWFKEHAWKVCIPPKGIQGSNPCLSADYHFTLIKKLEIRLISSFFIYRDVLLYLNSEFFF
jgi:hypothetical protein